MRALVLSVALIVPSLASAQEAPAPATPNAAAPESPAPGAPTPAETSALEEVDRTVSTLGLVTAGGMTLAQAIRMDYLPLGIGYAFLGIVLFAGGPAASSTGMSGDLALNAEYTPYVVDSKKRSALTGNPSRTIGIGLGQVVNLKLKHPDYGPLSLVGSFEAQTVPVADNGYVSLTANFFKIDVSVNAEWRDLVDARVGLSTFTNVLAINNGFIWNQGSQGKLSNQMLAGGLEGAVTVRLPVMGWFTLMLNGEGAYYPGLLYPDLDGGTAAFIAMAGYDDLRGADSYYWYRYGAKVRVDALGPLFDFFVGADFSSLIAGGKGSGVNNRGLSLTFVYR